MNIWNKVRLRTGIDRRVASTRCALAWAVLLVGAGPTFAVASELVYRPLNPSFGGDPRNSSHLLGTAGPQNRHRGVNDELSALEQFNERLQRSLLGRITSAVSRDIVDEDGNIAPGRFETLDYIIVITDEGGGLMTIETEDRVTGETTTIQVMNDLLP